MRPILTGWLLRHGLPGWLAPTYVTLAVVCALIGGAVAGRVAASSAACTCGASWSAR
jgi:hypothetical protein